MIFLGVAEVDANCGCRGRDRVGFGIRNAAKANVFDGRRDHDVITIDRAVLLGLKAVPLHATPTSGVGVEYDTDPRVPPTYFNLVSRFRPMKSASVAVFVGQRRGTLRCEGGVCREVPPFEGVRLDGSVRF